MIEKICYTCERKLPLSMFHKDKNKADGHRYKCKDCVKEYQKEWYENNKDERKEYDKGYRENNKDKRKEYGKGYRENNKDKRKEYDKNPSKYTQHRIVALQRYQKNPVTGELGTRRALDNRTLLEVKCKQCYEWFKPTNMQVADRIRAIRGQSSTGAESHLYCSDSCKNSCSIYGQIQHAKGFNTKSAREVDNYTIELCLERDDYECQKCSHVFDLEVHHIKGALQQPLLANDIDNVITLCHDCHKKIHAEEGCSTYDYRRPKCDTKNKDNTI